MMVESPAARFAEAARTIARETRARGYTSPSFRSPPRRPGVDRSIKHLPKLDASIVAVTIRGRPWDAVLADMIDGVIAANRLEGAPAGALRTALWEAVRS